MAFEFIDNNDCMDRKTRKRIRSLVATGKNAGKTVVRPSRIKAFKEQQSRYPTVFSSTLEKTNKKREKSLYDEQTPEIERQIGDVLCFLSTQLGPASRVLTKRAIAFMLAPRHAPELNQAFDTTENYITSFIRLMFIDEAFLHCSIALSVMVIDNLMDKHDDSREGIHHLCETFRLVNERLSQDGAIHISTIATVMMLAQYERHHSQHNQGLVHLNGLRRLINLRGGVFEIEKVMPILMQKVFRIDLEYALYMGTTTMFNVEHVIACGMSIPGAKNDFSEPRKPSNIKLMKFSEFLNQDIYDLLLDMTALSQEVNNANSTYTSKLKMFAFNTKIISFGYRVVSIPSYNLSRLESAVHLGLGMFVATFMPKLDRRLPDMPLLYDLLRSLIKSGLEHDQSVLLWILFLGEASILRPSDYEWLIPSITTIARGLNLRSWEDVVTILAKFPWINALYDKSGKALWSNISSYKF